MKPTSDSMFPLPGESPKAHFRRLADSPRPFVAEMANRLYSIPEIHIKAIRGDSVYPDGVVATLILPCTDFFSIARENGWSITYFNVSEDRLLYRASLYTPSKYHFAHPIAYAKPIAPCPRTGVSLVECTFYSR